MASYIDVDKKIEEMNMRIESTTKLIENRPYDEEARLILREHKFCLKELKNAPTADVVEVKHGEWEHECLQCSACKRNISEICDADSYLTSDIEHELLFCPFCGAKMDGGNAE